MKKKNREFFLKSVMLLLAISFFAMGLASIFKGVFFYQNYWGGLVFGPFATLVGILLFYIVFFRWKEMGRDDRDKKGRSMKWPTDDLL